MTASELDVDRRALHRAAGVPRSSWRYVVLTGLYVVAGPVPTEAEARLPYHATNQAAW